MVCGRRVRAAILLAVAFILCCAGGSVIAADDEGDPHLMLFSGRDLWRNGAFLYGGMVWAPGGFERDGFLFRALLSTGLYRYNASNLGGEEVAGGEWLGALMPGFRIKRGLVEMKFFAGPEYQGHRLWPDDPDNRLSGNALGLRFAGEAWAEPTPQTMVAADASLVSIGANYSARAAFGLKLFNMFYAGPETQVYGGDGYAQFRFGAHVTSLKTEDTEWSAAAGWAVDSDERSGAYLRLGLMQKVD